MPDDLHQRRSIPELERKYVETFRDLDRALGRLVDANATQADAPAWMTEQMQRGAAAVDSTSVALLGADGQGGLVGQLVTASSSAGRELARTAAEARGAASEAPDAEHRSSFADYRTQQELVQQTRERLQEMLNRYRSACERARQQALRGGAPPQPTDARPTDSEGEWSFLPVPVPYLRPTLKEVLRHAYESQLAASGIDLVWIVGVTAKCGTCNYAIHQRVFSLSGTHPHYPPLATVTVLSTPRLWHTNCPHYAVPFVDGRPHDGPLIAWLVTEKAVELGIGWAFVPVPYRKGHARNLKEHAHAGR